MKRMTWLGILNWGLQGFGFRVGVEFSDHPRKACSWVLLGPVLPFSGWDGDFIPDRPQSSYLKKRRCR